MYCASALPASASRCSSLAAAVKSLRRIEVFTASRGSAGRDTPRAAPVARRPSNASVQLLRSTRGLDIDADPFEKLRRQHATGAHDHRVVVYGNRRPLVLDRDCIGIDLL